MKIYRTVQSEFGNFESVFKGVGAANHPGRWNVASQGVIYCSSTIQTSVSERAFHSVLPNIESYNSQTSQRGTNIPMSYLEDICDVQFSLAEIEIADNNFLKIATDSDLQKILTAAGLMQKNLSEARKSMYQLLKPQFWTRQIAKFLNERGHQGFSIPSARTHHGETIVVFEDRITENDYTINYIVDLKITAISAQTGNRVKKGCTALTNKVTFDCPTSSGSAEVLKL